MRRNTVLTGLALAGFASLVTISCGDNTKATKVLDPIGSVSIAAPTAPPVVLQIGETHQFTAEVRYATGELVERQFTLTYGSSDLAIVTINSSGLATALSPGNVTITAEVEGVQGTAVVMVPVPGAQLALDPDSVEMDRGATLQLTATVYDADHNIVSLPVGYTSADPAVATVSGSGLVSALAAGHTSVTAASGSLSDVVQIVVTEPVATVDLQPATALIAVDDTILFTATPKDASGQALNRTVTWTSSDPAVATVDETGRVIGTGVGDATITASAGTRHGGGSVTVQAKVDSVAITSGASGGGPMEPGETLQLTATAYDEDGNVLTNRTVTWASNNEAAATVDQAGLVTAVNTGDATITATVQRVSATYDVRVVGETTTTGNNASVPIIFAEGIGITQLPVSDDPGIRPTTTEGFTVDTLPFWASSNTPDCGTTYYCQGGANTWRPEFLDGSTLGMQSAQVDWGDNLKSHTFSAGSSLRIEIRLSAYNTTLLGFNMPYVSGSGTTEMQGTDGSTAAMVPYIYAVTPRLMIEKLDGEGGSPVATIFDGAIWDGSFTAEVNVGGAVAYGYNLKGVDAGWYRITFSLDNSATVGGATIQRNVSLDQLEPPTGEELYTPQLSGQTSWLDIELTP